MKTYYDVHCHIFNKDVIIRRLVNIVQSLIAIKDMLNGEVSESELKFKIDGINRTLEKVTRDTSEEVFDALNQVYKDKVVTTPLMFDLTYADDNDDDENSNKRYRRRIKRIFKAAYFLLPVIKLKIRDKALRDALNPIRDGLKEFEKKFDKKSEQEVEIFDNSNYTQQIADLEYMAQKYKTVKPFFSVDPRREYKSGARMIDLLREKILAPNALFAGVKLYAPAGFSPTDPVLMGNDGQQGVYALCQEHAIPITVHNSNAGFACLSKKLIINGHIKKNGSVEEVKNYKHDFEYDFFSFKAGEAIKERALLLNHPKIWEKVMEKYPDLTINFAHFGGSGQILEYVKYLLPQKLEIDTFEKALKNATPEDKNRVKSIYTPKRKFLYLNSNIIFTERAKIWNIMYHHGIIDNWAKAIFDIVKKPEYPNAYTDLSCFSEGILVNLPGDNSPQPVFSIKTELAEVKRSFFDKLSDYEKSKILYGSDFFLAQFFGPTMEQYFADFQQAFDNDFDVIASVNPERFLGIKK